MNQMGMFLLLRDNWRVEIDKVYPPSGISIGGMRGEIRKSQCARRD
jgi:hypothetical protein